MIADRLSAGARLQLRFLVAGALIAVLMSGVFVADMVTERRSTLAQGQAALAIVTQSIARSVESDLTAVDLVLSQVQAAHVAGAWRRLDRDAAAQRLNDLRAGVAVITNLNLIDARGELVASAVPPPVAGISYADRAYFRETRSAGSRRLVISEPLTGRILGRPVVTLSRALEDRDGQFAGIASAVIDLRYFDSYPADTAVAGIPFSLQVQRSDGLTLFRHTPPESALPLGRVMTAFDSRDPPVDRVQRAADDDWSHARRRLGRVGIDVYTSQDHDSMLADWRESVQRSALYFAGALTAITFAVLALLAMVRQLIKAESGLRHAHQRTRLATAGGGAAIWEWDMAGGAMTWDEGGIGFGSAPPPTWVEFLARLPVQDRETVDASMRVGLGELGQAEAEFSMPDEQGALRWYLLRGQRSGNEQTAVGILQDITLRHHIEQQSIELARRQDLALRTARVGTWVWHADDDRFEADARLENMLGESLQHAEDLWRGVHRDDRHWARISHDHAVASGHWEANLRLADIGAGERHVAVSCQFTLAHGVHQATVGTMVDVTAVHRAEQEARAERDRARMYLDSAEVMMVALDLQGRVVLANRKTAAVLERSEGEVFGADWFSLALPAEHAERTRTKYLRDVAAGLADVPRRVEAQVVTSSARICWIEWHTRTYRDAQGKVIGILSSGVDISERREAVALRESRAFAQSILDSVDAEIAVIDGEGKIVAVNAAWSRFSDENAKDSRSAVRTAPGVNYLNICAVSPEGRTARDGILKVMRGLQPVYTLEYPCHSPDRERWFQMVVTPLGGHSGAVVVHVDVTARKAYEAEIEALNVSLAGRVREAEQARRAKEVFLANMSHELRTPMNAIIGIARMLGRGTLGPREADLLARLATAGDSLLALINDILDLSKLDAGAMPVERVPVELGRLLGDSVALLRQRAEDKGLRLAMDIAPELPAAVLGDPLRIGQILTNLLSNAVKFTEAGEVTVRATRRAGDPAAGGEQLVIAVSDTGIGIPGDVQARIFDPFVQADSSTTRRFGGTGLGLSIARRFATLMGGKLTVDSVPGQGATFCLSLPLLAAPADSEAVPVDVVSLAGGASLAGLHVLVAEDIEVNRLVVQDLLEQFGALVSLAEDGRQVLACLADAQAGYDVVLMDVQMPEMDGVEATRRLRSEPAYAHYAAIPVFALTAHAFAEERERCLAAGMNGHLAKPIEIERLLEALAPLPRRGPGASPAAASVARGGSGAAATRVDGSVTALATVVAAAATGMADTLAAAGVPRIEGIDAVAAVERMGGKLALFRRSLMSFLKYRDRGAQVAAALDAGDLPGAGRLAHGVKGMAATVGAVALARSAAVLEEACRGGRSDDAAQLSAEFLPLLEQQSAAVADWLAANPDDATETRA